MRASHGPAGVVRRPPQLRRDLQPQAAVAARVAQRAPVALVRLVEDDVVGRRQHRPRALLGDHHVRAREHDVRPRAHVRVDLVPRGSPGAQVNSPSVRSGVRSRTREGTRRAYLRNFADAMPISTPPSLPSSRALATITVQPPGHHSAPPLNGSSRGLNLNGHPLALGRLVGGPLENQAGGLAARPASPNADATRRARSTRQRYARLVSAPSADRLRRRRRQRERQRLRVACPCAAGRWR